VAAAKALGQIGDAKAAAALKAAVNGSGDYFDDARKAAAEALAAIEGHDATVDTA
jgi:HEAT repeat protein